MRGDGPNLVWGGDEERLHYIKSIRKSSAVRIEKALCRRCNDTRSQPFDRAYETYSAYVWENAETLWDAAGLDMRAIFAGLYEFWPDPELPEDDPERWMLTCAVLTTTSQDALGHVHDRSPVISETPLRGMARPGPNR